MLKKIIVDILLGILMLLEFSRLYLDPAVHEMMGIALVVLLIIHLMLNRKYLKAIPKGKYNHKRTVMLIVNLAFFIVFSLTIILGLLSSQSILTFLNIGDLTTVYLHKIFAYISLIILGMHVGMNIELKTDKKIFHMIYLAIIIFGIYSFIHLDILNHLMGNYGFGLANGNLITNTIEYASIVFMICILTGFLQKINRGVKVK